MNNYLAYKTNRAYVFSDFVWKREYYPWPMEKAIEWPPRTPLPALISGPTIGDPWPANDPAPRSISEKWFEIVCPREKRKIINTREYKISLRGAGGKEVFETWRKVLDGPELCIEIESATREEDSYPQVFDLWMWGSGKLIEIWDEFKESPVSRSLGASRIVEKALDINKHAFHANLDEVGVVDPYSRMLAIHLRRGDFREACKMLSDWNATYYSWNLFAFLPDKFTPPSGGTMGKNTPENEAQYMEHCLPSDDDILRKIGDSRRDYLLAAQKDGKEETVDVLYILTNDDSEWLTEVKMTMKNDGWRVITTSRDLKLDMEAKDVSMAVDMEIATKAAVFIGNGVSNKLSRWRPSYLFHLSSVVVIPYEQYPASTARRRADTHEQSLLLNQSSSSTLPKRPYTWLSDRVAKAVSHIAILDAIIKIIIIEQKIHRFGGLCAECNWNIDVELYWGWDGHKHWIVLEIYCYCCYCT